MAIKYGKTEIRKIAKLLDEGDFESAEDAADALLSAALEVLEARARFTVVGQLHYSPKGGGWLDKDDAAAAKVCLGFYSTEGDAQQAAESLVYSTQTHEQFLVWHLPVEHKTPAQVYKDRKEAHNQREIEAKRKGKAA